MTIFIYPLNEDLGELWSSDEATGQYERVGKRYWPCHCHHSVRKGPVVAGGRAGTPWGPIGCVQPSLRPGKDRRCPVRYGKGSRVRRSTAVVVGPAPKHPNYPCLKVIEKKNDTRRYKIDPFQNHRTGKVSCGFNCT